MTTAKLVDLSENMNDIECDIKSCDQRPMHHVYLNDLMYYCCNVRKSTSFAVNDF